MSVLSRLVKRISRQKCVYWEKAGNDPYGKPAWAEPVELDCRSEDTAREVITYDGRKVVSKRFLITGVRLQNGGVVWDGSLANYRAQSFFPQVPTVNQGGSEVVLSQSIPDVFNRGVIYQAYM